MNLLSQTPQQVQQYIGQFKNTFRSPQQIESDLSLLLESINLEFSQTTLEQCLFVFKHILDQYSQLNHKPQILMWRLFFTDLQNEPFKIDFAKQLFQFYLQLTECSPIFKTPIFLELLKVTNLLISIFCWDKDISNEVRNSKCLRSLIRMLRVLPSEELLLALCIISKNNKNGEYMTIKKAQELLLTYYRVNPKDLIAIILANLSYSSDQRLLFWCAGTIQMIKPQISTISLALIWRLSYDVIEVVQDLIQFHPEFLDSLPQKCNIFSEESSFIIGILRKLCEMHKEYKEKHINQIQYCFKQLLEQQPPQQLPLSIVQFIYKELFSFFGIAGNNYITPNLIPLISQVIITNLSDSKILTTGIGCLTNISTQKIILETIHNDRAVFQLILLILEQYYDKVQLIDYTLKLMINTIPNKAAAMQYGQPRILMKMLFIWHMNPTNISSSSLIVRIFRGLYIISPQFMDFLLQCINEVQLRNSAFNFVDLAIKTINEDLNQGLLDNVMEVFILLSLIPGLKLNDQGFKQVIELYVTKMKAIGELKRALQGISCLPIEDLGSQLQL